MAMLGGHIDYSPVLVTTKTTGSSSPSLMDRIQKFLKPFSWGCWVAVFAIIAFSGLTDFLLEYGSGGSVGASEYEYFAGVLWGVSQPCIKRSCREQCSEDQRLSASRTGF